MWQIPDACNKLEKVDAYLLVVVEFIRRDLGVAGSSIEVLVDHFQEFGFSSHGREAWREGRGAGGERARGVRGEQFREHEKVEKKCLFSFFLQWILLKLVS